MQLGRLALLQNPLKKGRITDSAASIAGAKGVKLMAPL